MPQMRQAFTLMEMVLVLALIVVLAGISYPAIDGMLADQRLTAAEDMIRGQCARARSRAINEGVPYRFAYVQGTGHWRIAPDSDDYWNGDGSTSASADPEAPPPLIIAGSLPRGIRFTNGGESGAATAESEEEVPVTEYQRLIVFLPVGSADCFPIDGSSQDYLEITLQGSNPGAIVLKFRGVTGTMTSRWQQ